MGELWLSAAAGTLRRRQSLDFRLLRLRPRAGSLLEFVDYRGGSPRLPLLYSEKAGHGLLGLIWRLEAVIHELQGFHARLSQTAHER